MSENGNVDPGSDAERRAVPPVPGAAGPHDAPRSDPPQQNAGDSPPSAAPTWGGAPTQSLPTSGPLTPAVPANQSKPWKRVAGGVVLAAVVAGGGVAAVTAASASSVPASTQSGTGGYGPGGYGPWGDGRGMSGNGNGPGSAAGGSAAGTPGGRGAVSALAGALHGEFVVQTQDGATQTDRLQSGQVTTVSADSLLVTSTDGFTATYAIASGLDISSIAVGDTVWVVATVSGDTVTAVSVQSGTGFMPGGAGGGHPGASPGDGAVPNGAAPTAAPSGSPAAPQTS